MAAEKEVSDPKSPRESRQVREVDDGMLHPDTLKRLVIVAAVALGGFLLGFVPMWLISTGYQAELDSAVKTLRPSVLQNTLATATINARRGEFEQARQQTSSFFTELRAELESSESAFVAEQNVAMRPILEQRDDTITLLARSDPASVDRLTDLYFSYLQVKNSTGPEKK